MRAFLSGLCGGLVAFVLAVTAIAGPNPYSAVQNVRAVMTSAVVSLGADSGTIGLWGVTPAARPSAFTQTYSTVTHTVPADTSHAITDSSGGTPSTSAIAAQAVTVAASACAGGSGPTAAQVDTAVDGLETAINAQLVIIRNNISTINAELTLTKADALATKKVAGAIIDDGQSWGALQ